MSELPVQAIGQYTFADFNCSRDWDIDWNGVSLGDNKFTASYIIVQCLSLSTSKTLSLSLYSYRFMPLSPFVSSAVSLTHWLCLFLLFFLSLSCMPATGCLAVWFLSVMCLSCLPSRLSVLHSLSHCVTLCHCYVCMSVYLCCMSVYLSFDVIVPLFLSSGQRRIEVFIKRCRSNDRCALKPLFGTSADVTRRSEMMPSIMRLWILYTRPSTAVSHSTYRLSIM